MQVTGYLKTSLIDYPHKLASVIYTSGCDFKCGFCHNKDLVEGSNDVMNIDDILKHLHQRKNILDGVVITGGEPTLQKQLLPFLALLKSKGLLIKLDTNGHQPKILKKILDDRLVDYIAMDIKNTSDKYVTTVARSVNMDNIHQSIELIMKSSVDYEFRTTWIKQYHQMGDINGIGEMIKGSKRYVLQQYQYSLKQIDEQIYDYYTLEEMGRLKLELQVQYDIEDVVIRGRF